MKNRDVVECFSIRLREKIELTGLSHSQFAASVGLTRATLSNYITGRSEPGLGGLLYLCKILNTTPNHLLGVNTTNEQNLDATPAKSPQENNNFSEPGVGHASEKEPEKMQDRIVQLEQLTQRLEHTINETLPDLAERLAALEKQ